MNEIKIFENPEFGNVRTLEGANGEVLFCGTDIAKALGYSNPSKAISDHCKQGGITKRYTPTTSGEQLMPYITEGNVYRLIARSKLPEAEKFEHWVFDEVLPSIRKHGAYMTDDALHRAITEPDFLIQLATELKEEQEKRRALESTVAVQSQQITELQPKASYYDVVLNSKDLLSIGKIAKDFGKSAVWLNKWLHEQGVQYKQGEIWLLYQKYAEQGYTNTKTQTYNGSDGAVHTKVHTYWTQKGRLFIYDLLKAHGILPLIERTN